jgi:hypothetical protein
MVTGAGMKALGKAALALNNQVDEAVDAVVLGVKPTIDLSCAVVSLGPERTVA